MSRKITEKIAISILKSSRPRKGSYDRLQVAFDMAIEALEKQIPKNVIYKPKDAVYQRPYCPNCGEELFDANYIVNRCECGQSLRYGG